MGTESNITKLLSDCIATVCNIYVNFDQKVKVSGHLKFKVDKDSYFYVDVDEQLKMEIRASRDLIKESHTEIDVCQCNADMLNGRAKSNTQRDLRSRLWLPKNLSHRDHSRVPSNYASGLQHNTGSEWLGQSEGHYTGLRHTAPANQSYPTRDVYAVGSHASPDRGQSRLASHSPRKSSPPRSHPRTILQSSNSSNRPVPAPSQPNHSEVLVETIDCSTGRDDDVQMINEQDVKPDMASTAEPEQDVSTKENNRVDLKNEPNSEELGNEVPQTSILKLESFNEPESPSLVDHGEGDGETLDHAKEPLEKRPKTEQPVEGSPHSTALENMQKFVQQQSQFMSQYDLTDPRQFVNNAPGPSAEGPADPWFRPNVLDAMTSATGVKVGEVRSLAQDQDRTKNSLWTYKEKMARLGYFPSWVATNAHNLSLWPTQPTSNKPTTKSPPTPQYRVKHGGHPGLPLKARHVMLNWLKENRGNPYPTEEEKAALILETNITYSQLNYWFVNARRRILPKWKQLESEGREIQDYSTEADSEG